MIILITGASGFVGTAILNHLHNKYNVIGIDHASKNSNTLVANLCNLKETVSILREKKIARVDIIIHLASVLANPQNLNDIEVLNQNNTLSYNITELAIILNAKKIINFSSSSVYPNIDGEFFEDSTINPSINADGIYGLSKFNSELIINSLLKHTNIYLTHLRCAMIYGKGVNMSRIWPVMEQELREKNTITVFGNGKRLVNQIEINYLLPIIEKLINQNLSSTYNVCEETISLENLAKRIISNYGNEKSKIVYVEKGNTFQFKLNSDKLKSIL